MSNNQYISMGDEVIAIVTAAASKKPLHSTLFDEVEASAMHSSGYESKKEIIQHLLPWPGEVRADRCSRGGVARTVSWDMVCTIRRELRDSLPRAQLKKRHLGCLWWRTTGMHSLCHKHWKYLLGAITVGTDLDIGFENYQRASPKTKTYQTFEGPDNSSGV